MRALEPTPWLIALTAAGLAGCATSSLDLAPPAPDRPWQPQTNAFGDIVPGPPRTGADAARAGYSLPNSTGLAFVEPAAQLDANHAYTLPELVDLAESTNPLTRIAWNDARNAALAAGIAKAAYLPQLSATAMGGYQASSGSASTPLGNNSTSSDIHGTVSLLALQWLLFDFGGRRARVDAATQLSVAANVAFTAVHQRVIHDVSIAYYGYEAASARAHTAQQALDNAGGILTAARTAEAGRGHGRRGCTGNAEPGAGESCEGPVGWCGERQLSEPGVRTRNLAFVEADNCPLPPRALSPALHQSVDEIVADAIARRPDVQGAYALEQANQARIRAAEAAFMPKVFVSATAAYGTGSTAITAVPPVGDQAATVNLSGSHRSGNVFVGVTIPLYDGGLRSAVLMQARNDADSASAQFTRTRRRPSGRLSWRRTRSPQASHQTMPRRRWSPPRRRPTTRRLLRTGTASVR